ncbi:MAG: hypothetical protein HZB43_07255, partial [candidate division Zixibacteria bacterium]|nr:hypothetical protein [candidate division Zixibacteria bacterium]
VSIADQIRVLLASDYPSERTSARLAIAPVPDSTRRFQITETDADGLLRENLFDYDCVLITEWRKPDQAVVDQLIRYVRGGGGVFVAPSIDADTTSWNRLIAGPHFGLYLGANPDLPNPERYFVWDRFTWDHPIWAVYKQVPHDKIPEIRWYSIFKVTGTSTGRPIVDFSGNWPSWTEVRDGSGKMVASWAPPNAPFTDLPLRSLYVPLIHRLVEYLAADLSERHSDYLVGDPIEREPARAITANTDLQVAGPEGTVSRPAVDWSGTQPKIRIGALERPGVYTLAAGEKPIDVFSVNVDPLETAPDRIEQEELQRRWPGYRLVLVNGSASLTELVKQARYGTEIRSTFLWAVMGLFLLEMFVARTRRKDIPVDASAPTMGTPTRPSMAG